MVVLEWYLMNISERINKFMKKQGLSRYKLAKMSNVPYTTLIKVLDGTTKNPQIETLIAIAEVLKVSVDDLNSPWIDELIEEGLKKNGLTIEELADRAKVKLVFLLEIDEVIPEPWDYETGGTLDRIAQVLKIDRRELAVAFSRQEPPAYDGPSDPRSLEEIFADEDFENDEQKEEKHTIPTWATKRDVRDFKKMLEEDAPVMFDGVPIEGEARQRVMDVLTGLFWEAKQMNKEKYGRKKKPGTETDKE